MESTQASSFGRGRERPLILVLPQILRTDSLSPGRLSAIPDQRFALVPGECLNRLWQNGCEVSVFMLPGENGVSEDLLPEFDGLLLVGGEDVHPSEWGGPHATAPTDPARDRLEFFILRVALQKDVPVLGICRGCQVVNVAMGGTLVEDLDAAPTTGHHRTVENGGLVRHRVEMSRTDQEFKDWPTSFEVASVHHQAVSQLAPGLEAIGMAPDGTIEAFAAREAPIMGVQWHPEFMGSSESGAVEPFEWLASASRRRMSPAAVENT